MRQSSMTCPSWAYLGRGAYLASFLLVISPTPSQGGGFGDETALLATRIGFFALLAVSAATFALLARAGRLPSAHARRGALVACMVIQLVAGLGYPLTLRGLLPTWALTVDLFAHGAVFPFIELAWAEAYARLEPRRAMGNVVGSLVVAAGLLAVLRMLPGSVVPVLSFPLPLSTVLLVWILGTGERAGAAGADNGKDVTSRPCATQPTAVQAGSAHSAAAQSISQMTTMQPTLGFYLGMLFALAAGNILAGSAETGGFLSWTAIVIGTALAAGLALLGSALALRGRLGLQRFLVLLIGVLAACYVISALALDGVGTSGLAGDLTKALQHGGVIALEQGVCAVGLIMLLGAAHNRLANATRTLALGCAFIFAGKAVGSIAGMLVRLDPVLLSLVALALFVPAMFFLARTVDGSEANPAKAGKEPGSVGAADATVPGKVADVWERHVGDVAGAFGLSPREQEVLSLWAGGHRLDYIAEQLCITKNTAKTHVGHIYKKTGTANREELIQLMKSRQR